MKSGYINIFLVNIAICNFCLHLVNIVMHIYWYSLATNCGVILSVIGIFLLLFSVYNYLLINGCQGTIHRNIIIWKVCCWIETTVLFGTAFAEGILILLYSNFLYFDVPIWYLLALCICAIIDIAGHLLFLLLISCCHTHFQKHNISGDVTSKERNSSSSHISAKYGNSENNQETASKSLNDKGNTFLLLVKVFKNGA